MSPEEQAEVIKRHWHEDAQVYKDAGEALRSSVDAETRAKALGQRLLHLERSDSLLDAYLEVRDGGSLI